MLIELAEFSMHAVEGDPPQIDFSFSQLSHTILPLPECFPSLPAFL